MKSKINEGLKKNIQTIMDRYIPIWFRDFPTDKDVLKAANNCIKILQLHEYDELDIVRFILYLNHERSVDEIAEKLEAMKTNICTISCPLLGVLLDNDIFIDNQITINNSKLVNKNNESFEYPSLTIHLSNTVIVDNYFSKLTIAKYIYRTIILIMINQRYLINSQMPKRIVHQVDFLVLKNSILQDIPSTFVELSQQEMRYLSYLEINTSFPKDKLKKVFSPISKLISRISDKEKGGKFITLIRSFNYAYEAEMRKLSDIEMSLLCYFTAFDCLFEGPEKTNSDVARLLAYFIADRDNERESIISNYRQYYSNRNKVIHGKDIKFRGNKIRIELIKLSEYLFKALNKELRLLLKP